MIGVVAILEAQAGKEKDFEDALRVMVPKVEAEEGTLAYILHKAPDNPAKFLFYELYQDAAAFDAHSSTPYIVELFGTIGPMLAGEPVIEMYDVLAAKK